MKPDDLSSERGASRTALGAARLRAAHLLLDGSPPILDDRLASRLLDPGAEDEIREHADRFRTPVSRALRCDVTVRARFAEDRLADAVRRGVRQYVILGAGLDTFAYRQPAWAGDLSIVEVDHAASQADKRTRLSRAGITTPSNVRYAAADLEADDLTSALGAAGLDEARPTFVACLGVLVYLSEAAIESIFATVAAMAAGSEFAFTFSRPNAAAEGGQSVAADAVAAIGEPWRTRLEPDALVARLRSLGFGRVRFLFAQGVTERYLAGRDDGLRAPSGMVLADATI